MTTLLFEVSVLHPAKELDCRGTVFGFDLLGVSEKVWRSITFSSCTMGCL